MKMLHTLIGAALIVGSSAVSADEPIALNDAELDGVTAGLNVLIIADGFAFANALALGNLAVSATATETNAFSEVQATGVLTHDAIGGSFAAAASVAE